MGVESTLDIEGSSEEDNCLEREELIDSNIPEESPGKGLRRI